MALCTYTPGKEGHCQAAASACHGGQVTSAVCGRGAEAPYVEAVHPLQTLPALHALSDAHAHASLAHEPDIYRPDVCGASWWAILHHWATAIKEAGCGHCGEEAESLMRFAHDLVNVQGNRAIFAPQDARRWSPVVGRLRSALDAQVEANATMGAMGAYLTKAREFLKQAQIELAEWQRARNKSDVIIREVAEKGWGAITQGALEVITTYDPDTEIPAGTDGRRRLLWNMEAKYRQLRPFKLSDTYGAALQYLHGEVFYDGRYIPAEVELWIGTRVKDYLDTVQTAIEQGPHGRRN